MRQMDAFRRAILLVGITLLVFPAIPGHAASPRFPKAAENATALSQDDSAPAAKSQPVRVEEAPARAPDQSRVTQRSGDTGTPATVIDDRDADGVLGKSIMCAAGEDMGRIIDVIVKRTGEVRAAVIDFGGFLGVGSRKIAVDWTALRFPKSGTMDHMILEFTQDQVRLAPEFRPGEPLVVLGSAEPAQTGQETRPSGEPGARRDKPAGH
jgi:hypothetical protein